MKIHPHAFITRLEPLTVGQIYSQSHLATWMAGAVRRCHGATHPHAIRAAHLYQRLLDAGTIAARQSCVEDFAAHDPVPWNLWPEGVRAGTAARMALYARVSREVALAAYPVDEAPPAALLQVTCTGYEAPTAAQRLIAERGWGDRCRLLHLGHMGCHAAIPALRLGAILACHENEARISIFNIELCTVHMALDAHTQDQVVIQHLFGDGAIRYDVEACPQREPLWAIIDQFETTLPQCSEDMTWRLGGDGFRMKLARRVPAMVSRALPGIVSRFLAQHGLYRADIRHYAVHPGGTRILEGVAASLELPESALTHSRAILRERGNMSSATLPHIWHRMTTDASVRKGDLILSLAFGPGLTITGNLLRRES